ncbi:hypothetical protein [Nonomuraea sp. SYSU D8015]|uniref:hypothetical protein n=1 Tax=Nonomuraea sp. SYSU D8015 TaxID=2593644 RepID=UPI0016611ADC|nr:hypothetical protein [Nonomuraea sp. SYSU D8015]
MTPEEETDALLDALGRGERPADAVGPGHAGGRGDHDDPAVRLLAALVEDVLDGSDGSCPPDDLRHSARLSVASALGGVGQRRSSVSMTPST